MDRLIDDQLFHPARSCVIMGRHFRLTCVIAILHSIDSIHSSELDVANGISRSSAAAAVSSEYAGQGAKLAEIAVHNSTINGGNH